MIKEIVNKGGV